MSKFQFLNRLSILKRIESQNCLSQAEACVGTYLDTDGNSGVLIDCDIVSERGFEKKRGRYVGGRNSLRDIQSLRCLRGQVSKQDKTRRQHTNVIQLAINSHYDPITPDVMLRKVVFPSAKSPIRRYIRMQHLEMDIRTRTKQKFPYPCNYLLRPFVWVEKMIIISSLRLSITISQ